MTSRGIWYFKDGKSVVISFSHPEARVKDAYLFYALTDRFSMWQYSSTGIVPGIEGNVDLNIQLLKK